jgi:hypothetical protein
MKYGNPLPLLAVMIVILFFLVVGVIGAIAEAVFLHVL